MLGVLRALAREGHHTVLLVTHNWAVARMADRVVRLRSGRLAGSTQVPHPVEADELEAADTDWGWENGQLVRAHSGSLVALLSGRALPDGRTLPRG